MANFWDVVKYYQKYWQMAIFSITFASIFELLDLVVPYAIGQILNVLSNQPLDFLTQNFIKAIGLLFNRSIDQFFSIAILLGLIFLATVVKAPFQPWLTDWYHWLIPLKARHDHAQKSIFKILTLPLEFYDENNPGRIASRVSKGLMNHTWSYPEIAGQLIPKFVRVLGIFTMICLIQWQIALFFIISFFVIITFTLQKLKYLIEKEDFLDKHQENTESRTSEIITNIKTVKAFATENVELKRQNTRLNRELKMVVDDIHRGYVNLAMRRQSAVHFCMFFVFGWTLVNTMNGIISPGYFVTIYTLISMAYSEITPISYLSETFARRYASMLRFHELMKLSSGSDAANLSLITSANFTVPHYKFTGKIELRNLTFGYSPEKIVLEEINLLINPYQTVALVGRSGSGKSTLVKLLFRYFEPLQGDILIDGENIRNLDVSGYRRRMAIVHQEVDVFNGTILDNLTYGNPLSTFPEVVAACQIAKADEFIKQLPEGYYTVVGERGVRLSGGQRQRLGIARALLVNPDVLVFDEATSSLDYESERSIQLAMQDILGTRTTIIIAHRLSTIREADVIVVLDQGKIVEVGSHDELLQKAGIYRRLHSLQETGELME